MAKFYLAIALPVMIVLCFLTQPLHSLDEPAHFLRVVQLSNGNVLPVLGPDRQSTGSLESNGVRAFSEFYGTRFGDYMKPERKTSIGELLELYHIKDSGESRFIQHSNTTIYFPLAYSAPVVAIYFARMFTDRPLIWLYIGRLANAFLGSILTYLVLRHASLGRLLILAVALLPITLFQTAALSADSLLLPAAMALAVMLGRLIEGAAFSASSCTLATLAGAFVGLGKIAYLPLVLILPVVALLVRRRPDRTVLGLTAGSAILLVVWMVWSMRINGLVFTVQQSGIRDQVDVHRQLALITAQPGIFIHAFVTTLGPSNIWIYATSLVGGVIGWLDTRFPTAITCLNLLVVGVAFILDTQRRRTPVFVRSGVYLACLGCVIAVFLLLYLQWNAVGAAHVAGVQGRYFLPLLPFLCVATPSFVVTGRGLGRVSYGLMVWGIFSTAMTLFYVARRYWGI